MTDSEREGKWRAWAVGGRGQAERVRFRAPVRPPGWQEQPWLELRALTLREALYRDSVGLRDEYELAADGRVTRMRRSYDFEAMLRVDLEHCLVDCLLPGVNEHGECVELGIEQVRAGLEADLLDRMPPELADWLLECLEAVNMRRPADREVLTQAKKD